METESLVALLRGADAVRFGEFELSNGGTSEYYIDKYLFETDPECLSAIADAFAARVGTETLAGVALGAVPLAAATSVVADRDYLIVRKGTKSYGTGNRIEGDLADGEQVVVLEDITTTGQSALEAVRALRDAGASVERVLAVVDREEGAGERLADSGVELEAVLTASALLREGSTDTNPS